LRLDRQRLERVFSRLVFVAEEEAAPVFRGREIGNEWPLFVGRVRRIGDAHSH